MTCKIFLEKKWCLTPRGHPGTVTYRIFYSSNFNFVILFTEFSSSQSHLETPVIQVHCVWGCNQAFPVSALYKKIAKNYPQNPCFWENYFLIWQGALLWFCCRFILVLCKNIKLNIINWGYWFKKLFFTIRPSFWAINVTHLFDIKSSY